LPGLRKIRFGSVTQQEIVQLFQEELGKVLSGDEQSSICMSMISGDWELMPNEIVSSKKLTPRTLRTPRREQSFFSMIAL